MKAKLVRELLDESRGLSGDFDKLSGAVAERVGLSQADMLAMDVISRGSPVTAGQLARELHLTTGAITGLIDRLEKAGFARRTADPSDRRKVLVSATAKERKVVEMYAPLAVNLRRAVEAYSDKDLQTLTEFVRKFRAEVAGTTESIRKQRSR